MAGPVRCVASRWSDEFGEERFFEFGEDRSLCSTREYQPQDVVNTTCHVAGLTATWHSTLNRNPTSY